jgi:carbonic anhydrase
MDRLIEGVKRFRHEHAGQYRGLFEKLSRKGQNPHTLFITCADSRVLASLLTHSRPGELFIVKNVGNVVPPSDSSSPSHSVAAAIEYAVNFLRVSDIVVCGHTQCGAMRVLLEGLPSEPPMPHLREWLQLVEPIRPRLAPTAPDRITQAAEENVRFALHNLTTYPCVAERVAADALRTHGWMFCIATMKVSVLDAASGLFIPVADE